MTTKSFLVSVLLVPALLFTGPDTAQPLEYPELPYVGKIPNDKGVLYVYRPFHIASFNLRPNIFINGEKQGPLFNGTFDEFLLDPGEYRITIKFPMSFPKLVKERDIEIEAGNGQFLGLFVKNAMRVGYGVMATKWDFRQVGRRTGVTDMARLDTPEEHEAKLEEKKREFEEMEEK